MLQESIPSCIVSPLALIAPMLHGETQLNKKLATHTDSDNCSRRPNRQWYAILSYGDVARTTAILARWRRSQQESLRSPGLRKLTSHEVTTTCCGCQSVYELPQVQLLDHIVPITISTVATTTKIHIPPGRRNVLVLPVAEWEQSSTWDKICRTVAYSSGNP